MDSFDSTNCPDDPRLLPTAGLSSTPSSPGRVNFKTRKAVGAYDDPARRNASLGDKAEGIGIGQKLDPSGWIVATVFSASWAPVNSTTDWAGTSPTILPVRVPTVQVSEYQS